MKLFREKHTRKLRRTLGAGRFTVNAHTCTHSAFACACLPRTGTHIRTFAVLDFSAFHVGHIVFAIYAVLAGSVVVQLSSKGKRAFDDVFTDKDRALVGAATFYLGLPAVLLIHELLQVFTLVAFGADAADVRQWIENDTLPVGARALSVGQIVSLTLVGGSFALVVGVGSILLALYRPANAAWNFARLELGRVVLGIGLVIHPGVSLLLGHGSAHLLRATLNQQLAFLGDAAAIVYVVLAILAVRFSGRGRFQRWYVEQATPLFHAIKSARARVQAEPDNAEAQRDLGGAYLAASRFDLADAPLTRSVALNPRDPRSQFLLGMLRLKQDDARAAENALCVAGQLMEEFDAPVAERRGLELEIVIALASARLRLKDNDGAIETAEAALQIARRDARALVVYSDALVAAGRSSEAHAPLSLALEDAHGSVEGEIRRRLAALERGR